MLAAAYHLDELKYRIIKSAQISPRKAQCQHGKESSNGAHMELIWSSYGAYGTNEEVKKRLSIKNLISYAIAALGGRASTAVDRCPGHSRDRQWWSTRPEYDIGNCSRLTTGPRCATAQPILSSLPD